eukprot:1047150-Pyramimonas_sp.AAC.1
MAFRGFTWATGMDSRAFRCAGIEPVVWRPKRRRAVCAPRVLRRRERSEPSDRRSAPRRNRLSRWIAARLLGGIV